MLLLPPRLVLATDRLSHVNRPAIALLAHFTFTTSNRRCFSAVISRRSQWQQVSVPTRTNGAIKLDILPASTPASPILVYLPSGPLLPNHSEEEESVISTLAESSRATIARINYRASPEHQYPTPFHDVLFGYDWILDNLVHPEAGPVLRNPRRARLAVCGELMGASLATMLALTECRRAEDGIIAAAVNNPIVDWVFPDDLSYPSELPEPVRPDETQFPADQDLMTWWAPEGEQVPGPTPAPQLILDPASEPVQKGQKRAPKPSAPTSWQLHADNDILPTLTLSAERDVLFRKPEDYFDRFVSPIHFFRSPHGYLVYPYSHHGMASSSPSEQPTDPFDWETRMAIDHFDSFDAPWVSDLPTLARCRAYARIYPPSGSRLALPRWHIATGTQSPLHDQAAELAKMVKRSIARQTLRANEHRDLWHDPAEKAKYETYAEQRVNLHASDGTGLWTQPGDNPNWKSQVGIAGTWIGDLLRQA
ncbi:alpha/beta-hydrolase [Pleomassaria siparia CBS 279.74]|uniref:Alpha/beta-hydrolase n=1 Tax=Pleomassaria siparia CBS 279.74 TaxID=1314801 RepID=A0A6G1KN45_9PLEO|nr:alpha/beta-hydrolase [Pleomassaria siparia CBS 279.74]